MAKSLAVAMIHGIGSQEGGFSTGFVDKLRARMSPADFDEIAFEEILWADILIERQRNYLKKIKRKTRGDILRGFVLDNLSDALAYRQDRNSANGTYDKVHSRVGRAIKKLERRIAPDSPLVVLAHSLGGHVISNYVWDMQNTTAPGLSDFQKLHTMGGFVTFGCNIPLFVFSLPVSKIKPIAYPGTKIPVPKRVSPWWLNFYDKDDILGYPLAEIGPRYAALESKGKLREKSINVGNLLEFWNPLSHLAYWTDEDFVKPVAKFLGRFI